MEPASSRGARPPGGAEFGGGALLREVARVWGRNALQFTAISALAWTPIAALLIRVAEKGHPVPFDLFLLFVLALRLISTGAISQGVLQDLAGTRPRLPALLSSVAARLWSCFAVGALYGTGVVAGMILVIPGFLALSAGYLALPAIVAEPALKPAEAMRRSWELTQGRRTALLSAILLLWGAAMLLGWLAYLFIDAAPWIPPVPGTVAFLAILAVLDGVLRCGGAVAFHLLRAAAPVDVDSAPTLF